MGWFSHVQSQGIPAVEFRARCDLIFDKYDKDVSLGRWVRGCGCGGMKTEVGYAAFTLCWCQGLYQWGVGRKLQAPTIVWKKRRIDPFLGIYWVCVFFLPLPANQIFTVTIPDSIWGESSNVWCHMPRFASRSLLIVVFWGVQGLLIQIRVWHFTKHRYCMILYQKNTDYYNLPKLLHIFHIEVMKLFFSSDMAWNQLLCPGQRRDSLLWGHLGRVKTWSIRTISRRMMSLHRQCWFLKSRGLPFTIPSQFIPVYEMGYHVDHEMW